jgi:DNA polymerase III delta prime subunit
MNAGDGRRRGEEEPADHGEEMRVRRLAAWRKLRAGLADPARLPSAGVLDPAVAAWVLKLRCRDHSPDGVVPNLVLSGPPGAGKTWNALAVIETAYEQGWPGSAAYMYPQLWRETFTPNTPAVQRDATVRLCQEVSVLILDDLTALRLNDWDLDNLYLIVDARWRHARPTIVIVNDGNVRDAFGERVASRLAHGYDEGELGGPDHRRDGDR